MSTEAPPLEVDLARKRHVLAVAGDVTAADVETLALAKYPDAYWTEPDVLTLAEHAHLSGPFGLDGAARHELALPAEVAVAYLLTCPRERGGPVPPALAAHGGVLAAFADGAVEGAEAVAIDVLLALSRRLGGVVRTDTGHVIEPEEWAGVDLRVYAPVWLYPDALMHVLDSVLPGIQVPDEPRTGETPAGGSTQRSDLATDLTEHGVAELDASERAWLHAEADAYDAHAMSQPEVLEAYGANWSYPSGGVITVSVEAAHEVPHGVPSRATESESGDGVMLYELRWYCADPVKWRENPPPIVLRNECADARMRIEAATAALVHATGGQATDDDEFLVGF